MRIRYYTVDAFTDKTFEGAQIAVIPNASGLTDAQMQNIAREFNLSETVFALPPMSREHAKRLRIFNPREEIPFGGHPTLAAAHVLTTIGDITADMACTTLENDSLRFIFEETVGPIHITVSDPGGRRRSEFGLSSNYSIDRYTPTDQELAGIFSLSPSELGLDGYQRMVVAADKPYLIVPIRSFAAVRRAKFDYRAWSQSAAPATLSHQALLFTTETEFDSSGYHCRLLGPNIGVNEDPPIGSSIPAFAGYLCQVSGPEHSFAAERGAGRSRRSLLQVKVNARGERSVAVRVGGTAVLVCDGHLHL